MADPLSQSTRTVALEKIPVSRRTSFVAHGIGFGLYGVCALLGLLTWGVILVSIPLPFLQNGLQFNLGFWFFVAVAGHAIISLFGNEQLGTDEHGVLYFFGVPVTVYHSAGLKFVFWGFFTLDRLPKDLREIHAPGKKDKIFWGDDDAPVPAGMVRAIRMTTKPPENFEDVEKNPLDAQLTVGLGYFVLWTIKDPVQFRGHIRTIEEAESQLRAMSMTALSEIIGTISAREVNARQAEINRKLDDVIREKIKGWGIEINDTGLTDINMSHILAKAMRDKAAAGFQRDTEILRAQGEAESIRLVGEAKGKAAEAAAKGELTGRAQGMKAIQEELDVDGAAVLASETIRNIGDGTDLIIAGGQNGLTDLIGMVKAGQAAFGSGSNTAPKKGG